MTSLDVGVRSRLQPAGVGISVVCGYVCVCYRGVGQGGERGETWLVFQWEVSSGWMEWRWEEGLPHRGRGGGRRRDMRGGGGGWSDMSGGGLEVKGDRGGERGRRAEGDSW